MKKEERERLQKKRLAEMKQYEEKLYESGISYIAGVDEVGRGPLAGPVVAAAVVLPVGFDVLGVDDSKKLTPKKREKLYDEIKEKAIAIGLGQVEHDVIDQINILQATKQAMIQAIIHVNEELEKKGLPHVQHILFDAIRIEGAKTPQTSIVKGQQERIHRGSIHNRQSHQRQADG